MAYALALAPGWMFETCCRCGVEFAMTTAFHNTMRADAGRMFYCPNGDQQHYAKTTRDIEVERLKERAARAEREATAAREARDWAQKRTKGANIAAGKAKAELRRTLERVNAGVCPHCHRTFRQLARHMQSKHACAR